MPVSIARRHALKTLVAATAVLLVALVVRLVMTAATPAVAAPSIAAGTGTVVRLDTTRVDFVTGASEARYRAQEVLSGRGFNEGWAGRPECRARSCWTPMAPCWPINRRSASI